MEQESQALKDVVYQLTKHIKKIEDAAKPGTDDYTRLMESIYEAKKFCITIGTWEKVDLSEEPSES